jgi:hypothetical protein
MPVFRHSFSFGTLVEDSDSGYVKLEQFGKLFSAARVRIADVTGVSAANSSSGWGLVTARIHGLGSVLAEVDMLGKDVEKLDSWFRTKNAKPDSSAAQIGGATAPTPRTVPSQGQLNAQAVDRKSEPDLVTALARLAELRASGALTDEEFTLAKRKLLGVADLA